MYYLVLEGAAGLQDQLRSAEASIETMRNDYATLHRQSQARVDELEASNAELTEGKHSFNMKFTISLFPFHYNGFIVIVPNHTHLFVWIIYDTKIGLTERQREVDRLQRALSQAGSEEARAVGRELDG